MVIINSRGSNPNHASWRISVYQSIPFTQSTFHFKQFYNIMSITSKYGLSLNQQNHRVEPNINNHSGQALINNVRSVVLSYLQSHTSAHKEFNLDALTIRTPSQKKYHGQSLINRITILKGVLKALHIVLNPNNTNPKLKIQVPKS